MNQAESVHAGSAMPVNRDAPDRAFIESVRTRFPTERETDWAFTRRMERRASGPFRTPSLDELLVYLRAMLQDKLDDPFEIAEPGWLGGGGSKLQLRFCLSWKHPRLGPTRTVMVLRMEPAESLNPSSRLREFQILQAVAPILPVPEVYWVDALGQWFPEPTLIYGFSPGVAKPSTFTNRRVTGMGINFGPDLRKNLGQQFVECLARLHTHDFSPYDLSSFDVPPLGTTEAASWQLNRALRGWEEDREEAMPLLDVAAQWLTRHLPTLDHASLIHGDYRTGNFLYDEATEKITSVLDWERCTIGDRHRDLAWATSETIGHYDEEGRQLLICGTFPLEEFLERYSKASGLAVDPKRMTYYTILSRFQQVVTVLWTGYRVVRLQKSHQDILLARIEAAAYVLAEELRQELARAIG